MSDNNSNIVDADTGTQQGPIGVGGELPAPLELAVQRAVDAQITKAAKDIADGVVEQMLTPAVVAGIRERAVRDAEQVITGSAAADPAAAAVEQPQELFYKTPEQFVEQYVLVLYRRRIATAGAEAGLRWCPWWWKHGEVTGRMRALWRAFEELRTGKGIEPSQWWLQYFDPMMAQIMDPEGPFRYCTVEGGHSERLTALPTTPIPDWVFADETQDSLAETGSAAPQSRLIVPDPAYRGRRVVMEFPG